MKIDKWHAIGGGIVSAIAVALASWHPLTMLIVGPLCWGFWESADHEWKRTKDGRLSQAVMPWMRNIPEARPRMMAEPPAPPWKWPAEHLWDWASSFLLIPALAIVYWLVMF